MNFKDMSKEERKAFVRFLLGKFRIEQDENRVLFPGLKSASSSKSQFYDSGHGGTSKKINGLLAAFATLCDVEIPAEYKKTENGKTLFGDRFSIKKCNPSEGVVSPSIQAELVRWATDYVRERENSVVATLHAALKLASKPQLKFDVNTLKCIWLGVTITIQQNNDIKFSAIQSLANDFLKAVSVQKVSGSNPDGPTILNPAESENGSFWVYEKRYPLEFGRKSFCVARKF